MVLLAPPTETTKLRKEEPGHNAVECPTERAWGWSERGETPKLYALSPGPGGPESI